MLEHHETVVGHLESIDQKLAILVEKVQHLPQLASYLADTLKKPDDTRKPDDGLETLLDKTQVMEYLDIKDTAYYRWVKEGKLKPRGGKGRHKYFPGDIKKLMEQRKYRKRG